MRMRFLVPAVFAVATLTATSAQAQPGETCSTSDVLFEGIEASDCFGSFRGNDVPNNFDAILAWFVSKAPGTDWEVLAKSDDPNDEFFDYANNGSSGFFEPSDPVSGTFGVSIKEGRFYSAYIWIGAPSGTEFEYVTPNGKGLSHVTFWGSDELCPEGIICDPRIVPEPSSFAMVFLGLAGLGVAARRRRKV